MVARCDYRDNHIPDVQSEIVWRKSVSLPCRGASYAVCSLHCVERSDFWSGGRITIPDSLGSLE